MESRFGVGFVVATGLSFLVSGRREFVSSSAGDLGPFMR